MKITLRDNAVLLKVIDKSVDNDCIAYAQMVGALLIDDETRRLTMKYDVNVNDLILIGTKPLSSFKTDLKPLFLLRSVLKGKRIYFSRLFANSSKKSAESSFEFSAPEQFTFEIENPACKKLMKINKSLQKKQKAAAFGRVHREKIGEYLEQINREVVSGLIRSAKRDFDFVFHFNSEMFHQNLTAKGHVFTKETVVGLYEDERYTGIIDLSDPRERMGFIALYAITFRGLTLYDLYSIDSIFTMDIEPENLNREADNRKKQAGNDVFNLIFNENREEILRVTTVMAEALMKLPLPEIDISINTLIKQNYSLYCGAADIGRAFSRLILSVEKSFEDAVKAAKRLSYYKLLEKYYDSLERELGSTFGKFTEIKKQTLAFAREVSGKKTAGELNFAVRGTQHFPLFGK